MLRLYITISLVLFTALFFSVMLAGKVEMAVYHNDGEPFFSEQYRGTFTLLDEAVVNLQDEKLQSTLISLRNQFSVSLQLLQRDNLDLSVEGLEVIDSGMIYLHDLGTSSSIYRQSSHTDQIWMLPVSLSSAEERIAFATGPLNLIQEKLGKKNASLRKSVIDEIQQIHGVPVKLVQADDLDLNIEEFTRLQNHQTIVRNPYLSGETFLQKLQDSHLILQFGPITYPTSFEYTQWMFIAALVIGVTAGVLIWIWPLWRDLQSLRVASREIGNGNLSTRVHSRQTSLIRSVLDGFNYMAIYTERMLDSQRELTRAVSHELRTPLARMMFDLQMAKDAENTKDQSRHFDSFDRNVEELNTLVDELLTYARQERIETALDVENFTLKEMASWLRIQVQRAQSGQEHHCRMTTQVDVKDTGGHPIAINTKLMGHALSNALQNALRYAKKNVAVQLQRRHSEWVIGIEDDGIGVPICNRERVFEPFSRLDESRQRGSGGFGLGLSIVRKIAQWHHGDARIVPCELLSGTRVEIYWPVPDKDLKLP